MISSEHCSLQENRSTELLDVEKHKIHSVSTERMGNLSSSDAPDMSTCRKLPDYTHLVSYTDCMWHGINRVVMCEVIDEVYVKIMH